jgi:hypothetical protein
MRAILGNTVAKFHEFDDHALCRLRRRILPRAAPIRASLTKTNGDERLLGVPFLTRRPSHHSAGWKTPASPCSDSINGAGSALGRWLQLRGRSWSRFLARRAPNSTP